MAKEKGIAFLGVGEALKYFKGTGEPAKSFFFFFFFMEKGVGKTFSGADAICFSGSREFCRGSSLRQSHRFP